LEERNQFRMNVAELQGTCPGWSYAGSRSLTV
jgi:hypothetical protein